MIIVKQLFANLAILVALLFLYTQIKKDPPLRMNSSIKKKLTTGVAGGLFSNILMQYSIPIGTIIIDLRHIPIILLAYFGGAVPALIGMVLVIAGRFLIGINISSYASSLLMIAITLFAIIIARTRLSQQRKKWCMLTFANLLTTVLFLNLIEDQQLLFYLIPGFWIVSFLSGYVAFQVLHILFKSQMMFDKYKAESTIDPLTGLNNVRKFDEVFNSSMENLDKKKLSLLYIDIDFFKKINDTYGHSEGDVVLKDLGLILRSCSRPTDIVSRNGGEEFTVLLVDCSLNQAQKIAERIRSTVEQHAFVLNSGKEVNITVSVGVSNFPETTTNGNLIIKDADKALYEAKKTGRNKVCIANQ
ncbi:diguanylate cyclase [Fictibacillus nanhaiensis]|uniref:GGDEF domain-containing protein n=1 Tax=Fictibacillus nanhaiensis TaxID=742169 RepID=UPI002E1AF87F|nr:diguanylate cyclase [Fictibacillus nanhaiensis]MED1865313.1 diguanylate cyclase [Fictibacillus nanhaiensis]